MLIEVTNDQQLRKLLSTSGFLVNVDYPTKYVTLHMISCRYCDPKSSVGVKPSSKRLNNTGEFWYSENPFEGLYNDVPISTMARSIEIDIRQMLDETDLPKPLEPVGEYKLLF